MGQQDVRLCGESECLELEAFLVERIYEVNARATGHFDGRLLGGSLRNENDEIIAAFNGHTWGGCAVIDHLWVHEAERGHGLGRLLIEAAEAEAARRGCGQLMLSTHSFQAPEFYERLGYQKRAVVPGRPISHDLIVYAKQLVPDADPK